MNQLPDSSAAPPENDVTTEFANPVLRDCSQECWRVK